MSGRNKKDLFKTTKEKSEKKTISRLTPSENSLDVAQEVADSLAIKMDREETRKLAFDLLGVYYAEIVSTLGLTSEQIRFDNFLSERVSAFSTYTTKGEKAVFFDQQLDNWIFSFFTLMSVRTFCHPSDEERGETTALMKSILDSFYEPEIHHRVKMQLFPYMKKYPECLPVVNCLNSTMSAFIICHEITHHVLGHTDIECSKAHEYEADKQAYELLKLMSLRHVDGSKLVITQNFLCSPVLLMQALDVVERWRGVKNGENVLYESGSYPFSYKREHALTRLIEADLDAGGLSMRDGFTAAYREALIDLGLEAITFES